jgi:hypothetical protein
VVKGQQSGGSDEEAAPQKMTGAGVWIVSNLGAGTCHWSPSRALSGAVVSIQNSPTQGTSRREQGVQGVQGVQGSSTNKG